MKKLIALAMAGLLASGCTTHRFQLGNATANTTPAYNRTHHSAGFNDFQKVDAASICGSAANVGLVETEVLTHQVWLRLLTANIYRPYAVRVYCKGSPVSNRQAYQGYAQQGYYYQR